VADSQQHSSLVTSGFAGTWIAIYQSTPCIISADGFHEWRKEGKRKVPMWVHLKSKKLFAFTGLWNVWRKPHGKRVESFAIITTEPNELVRPVHKRMPVILRPEDEEQWLDASRTPFAKAKSLEALSRSP